MGKYMRKDRITGDVAVMEILSHTQSSLGGVRTRAKTHAFETLQSTTDTPPPPPEDPDLSYLQLRNRRLEKILQPFNDTKKQQPPRKNGCGLNPNINSSANAYSGCSIKCLENEEGVISDFTKRACNEIEAEDQNYLGIEPSFGENYLEIESRERSTRESTPCSLIRASDAITTPGSTTRRTTISTRNTRRIQNTMQRNIPTSHEMEEFFVIAEQQQQRFFNEKYNFDVVNDLPLPGRYEWVRVSH